MKLRVASRLRLLVCALSYVALPVWSPPAAASGLAEPVVAAVPGVGQVVLTWNKIDGAEKYNIYFDTVSHGANPRLETTVTTNNYVYHDLDNGKAGFFTVLAVSGSTLGDVIGLSAWDVQARVAYTFAGGSAPTANTILGSGDFNAELSVGLPIFLVQAADKGHAFTVGIEAGYGAVTERGALKAHRSPFAGVAYNTQFKDPVGAIDDKGNPRRVLLNFRLLCASVDTVRYVSDDSTEIHAVNGALPRYFSKWTDAFESELLYPVNKSSFVTFSGRVYPSLTPGLWSIQVGLSTSFSDLLGAFFK